MFSYRKPRVKKFHRALRCEKTAFVFVRLRIKRARPYYTSSLLLSSRYLRVSWKLILAYTCNYYFAKAVKKNYSMQAEENSSANIEERAPASIFIGKRCLAALHQSRRLYSERNFNTEPRHVSEYIRRED